MIRSRLPATLYGGTERVAWWLARELAARGHDVTLLAGAGTECSFARVRILDPAAAVEAQLPEGADLLHFHFPFTGTLSRPYLSTVHGNGAPGDRFDRNSVFVSRDHARRHGSEVFVHNGIDPADYGDPRLGGRREYVHFLAKAAWRLKNVRGAVRIARRAGIPLRVLGGSRLNFRMGFRFTVDPNVSFHGMVGGAAKNELIGGSRALLFPVLWHEPFGLAIVESLFFGCPVIATPWGSLPELVPPEVGRLSDREDELVDAVREVESIPRRRCHDWVMEHFTPQRMADDYLALYHRVAAGETLNREAPVAQPAPACSVV